MKVLIIGGYGTFGGRLVRLLCDDNRFTLLIAGRSLAKAQVFCGALIAKAKLVPTTFDRDGDVARQLASIAPDAVVDASGPFQVYGEDCYRVVTACLTQRIHYLDFADARGFVIGIAQFDTAARTAGVTVLSGVSTLPALSAAVLRRLADGLVLRAVAIGIAPSPFAGMGLNVIRMIAGYAGKPVQRLQDGRLVTDYAMTAARRVIVAPPGHVPLRPRQFSLADTPDLSLVPQLWPEVRSVWAGAGTEPVLWHRVLNRLAGLVRLHLLPSLAGLAPLFHWVGNHLVWGEPRGGMYVAVTGEDARGETVSRSWDMIADGDSGPFVPSIAAAVLLRRWASGHPSPTGARACTADVDLSEYEEVFAQLGIVSAQCDGSGEAGPLYRRLLGQGFNVLPEAIRTMHDGEQSWRAEGRASVERGAGILARLAATLFGFPRATPDVPVSVQFDANRGSEIWTRNFGGNRFASVQSEGRGRNAGLMCERFGPFTFAIALVCEPGRLRLVVRGWRLFAIPLPRFLAPRGDTCESVEDGRFQFHVEIGFPWTGLIVRYRGWLLRT
jgi:hypothetical protein